VLNVKTTLTEKIAGEIVLSPKPGQTLRKWREIFRISQTELAGFLRINPSVICDYESGRRKSPGIQIVKKMIEAFLTIDEQKHNGTILRQYQSFAQSEEGILDIMEYPYGIPIASFIDGINGTLITSPKQANMEKDVHGFTIVDSIKTITTLNAANYVRLYGWSTDRNQR
jgi:putative transcriptional regulator